MFVTRPHCALQLITLSRRLITDPEAVTRCHTTPPTSTDRMQFAREMHRRYASTNARRLQYWRKRYMWRVRRLIADAGKRALDVAGAVGLLILLSPLASLVAATIWRSRSGSLLIWQTHVGKCGKEFSLPRLRSVNCPVGTTVSGLIRRLRIERWPNLWCVLVGEMSLVGPRAATPDEVAEYSLSDRRRLGAKPGLICTSTPVDDGSMTFSREARLDIEYIENRNLWLDFGLLANAGKTIVRGRREPGWGRP